MTPQTKHCVHCGARYPSDLAFCPQDGTPLVFEAQGADPYLGTLLFGEFQIEQALGVGGMGRVYRARQRSLEREVAVKILHRGLESDDEAVARFRREAKLTAGLDHPNLVRVYFSGQLPDGSLYILMEYLAGRSLVDVLRDDPAMPLARAVHVIVQICDAIGEAHMHGIVHRDIKPENVLLIERARDPDFVKVLDFGIARLLDEVTTLETSAGVVLGTARYISPEGASGQPTDARSDVYSIGVLAYELLCGSAPFETNSPEGLLRKHVSEIPPDIRRRSGGRHVPAPVAEVIMRALQKRPDSRHTDASELAAALRAALLRISQPPQPMPASVFQPGTSRGDRRSGSFHTDDAIRLPPRWGLSRARKSFAAKALLAFGLGAAAFSSGAWVSALVRARNDASPKVESTATPEPAEPVAPALPDTAGQLNVFPEMPKVGETVTLLAVLPKGFAAGANAAPAFIVSGEGAAKREILAAPVADRSAFAATYAFDRVGHYEVEFRGVDAARGGWKRNLEIRPAPAAAEPKEAVSVEDPARPVRTTRKPPAARTRPSYPLPTDDNPAGPTTPPAAPPDTSSGTTPPVEAPVEPPLSERPVSPL